MVIIGHKTIFIRASPFNRKIIHKIVNINAGGSKLFILFLRSFQYKIVNGIIKPIYAILERIMSNGRLDNLKILYTIKPITLPGPAMLALDKRLLLI
jgi:hypothetical protein